MQCRRTSCSLLRSRSLSVLSVPRVATVDASSVEHAVGWCGAGVEILRLLACSILVSRNFTCALGQILTQIDFPMFSTG